MPAGPMDFCIQLSAYYPDHRLGGRRLYQNMLDQAVLADRLGFDAVSITEHHLINILLMPAPLPFAVKIAGVTGRVKIITSVVVLPLHDMRVLAGQLVCTDIFTDGRLLLGVGRGAFAFEMERMGVPLADSREKFDESLAVLQALLSEDEVSWDGKYYRFASLTIMPRPATGDGGAGGPPMMLSALRPQAIYRCARRGFHIQTTPLSGDRRRMREQVEAFHRGRAEAGARGDALTLSLSRVAFAAAGETDARAKTKLAHHYYGQFDNVFGGPGLVERGLIAPLPRRVPIEETARNLHICTAPEMVEQLAPYAEAGVDRFILNVNFGAGQTETLESIQRFAEEVMPHFTAAQPSSPAHSA
ncbi:MAG: LLM class flavin-dependent oxidoreductase [Gammaproteobacteria bacterium]|nr:LLM class flavin-dependent oxidoreductase [Gammaproteobacteria bacterium]